MEQKFKVGDKVRVVDTKHDCKKHLVGKDFTIKKSFKGVGNNYVYDVGKEYLLNEPELELVKHKFKVGDKVKIVKSRGTYSNKFIGDVVTINELKYSGFDGEPMYDVMGTGAMDWYWFDDELELVHSVKFNIEDYPGKYAMYCKTEKDAYDFCRYLHSVGRKWITNRTYIETQNYHYDKHGTVYYFNEGLCDSYEMYNKHNKNKYILSNFEDFDWSDFTMKKEFTKKDLKNGDVIKRRNGDIEIVCVDTGACIAKNNFNRLSDVNDDLTVDHIWESDKNWDIVAVRRPKEPSDCEFRAFDLDLGELVYERKEVEEMTLEEVCKALGKEIKIVKK
jgi:hypothetical protein